MKHYSFLNRSITSGIVAGKYKLDGLTPQAKTIVAHMAKAGSISLREAIADHSIQSLTRRITEIEKEGIKVNRESCNHPLTSQRYMRYSLANQKAAL